MKKTLQAATTQTMTMDVSDPLVKRLTRLNIRVLATSLLLTFLLMAIAVWTSARHHQLQNANASAAILANSLASSVIFDDKQSAAKELDIFAKRSEIQHLTILTKNGDVLVDWSDSSKPAKKPTSSVEEVYLGWTYIQLSLPILLEQEQVGVLQVQESLERLNTALFWLLSLLALLTLSTLFLAARGLRIVQQRVLAPIVDLANLADYAAQHQDYSKRGVVYQADEVGRLTEHLNELFKRTEIWQQELTTQLQREQQTGAQLKQLAHHDSLTALPNRLYFQNELQIQIDECQAKHTEMALMFIDLDNFKTVNDTWGHDYGDEVLKIVAKRMQQVLRHHDLLCRLGGDEFAILLPAIPDQSNIELLAQRILQTVQQPLMVKQQKMPIGATIGLAFYPQDAITAAELLQRSDAAMYAAKRAGKNTYRTSRSVQTMPLTQQSCSGG